MKPTETGRAEPVVNATDVGLSERELDEIALRHERGSPHGWDASDYCTFCTALETVAWPCDAVRAVMEVRRLRLIETAAARVNDVWFGFDETEKFNAWRALNVALSRPTADRRATPPPVADPRFTEPE